MGTRERRERSDQIDREITTLFLGALTHSGLTAQSVALCAVGGYGRGELSPGSDLDILVLHTGIESEEKLGIFVNALLYPLWNSHRAVDHSIRTRGETRESAAQDIKVAAGLLDLRFVVGNQDLYEAVAMDAREDWRKNFRKHAAKFRESIDERAHRSGELAFLLEPDLKVARGGLRDVTALRAIARSEAVPVALGRLAAAESLLANVRDVLHEISGRGRDQLLLIWQDQIADVMNYEDADVLMFEVAKAARSVDYLMDLTWHRIDHLSHGKGRSLFRRFNEPKVVPLGKGLELYREEVDLVDGYEITLDPGLGLRAAAICAQRGIPLSVEACMAIAENFVDLPTPWPRTAREDLVALIGSGREMIRVFEALDQEQIISRWIPEWEHVRFLPQRNVLHRHTVDRHMLETAVRAAALTRQVHRPDLLLVAALFHDIGKGFAQKDHSDYGAELILPLALRLGFDEPDAQTLVLLVKHHLLLSATATRRDLDDPATVASVVAVLPDAQTLELLHALSIADGEATGKTAWSDWKAGLVQELVNRTLAAMQGTPPAPEAELTEDQLRKARTGKLSIEIKPRDESFEIEIVSPDSVGLLSVVAGVLSISRMDLRSARTRTYEGVAVMSWLVALDVHAPAPSEDQLKALLESALAGELNVAAKIEERIKSYKRFPGIQVAPPAVYATNDLATGATIIEVRMHDQPGVLYNVARLISRFGVDIRAAIVATLGAEAMDTLYITDPAGGALSDERAKSLASQIEKYILTL